MKNNRKGLWLHLGVLLLAAVTMALRRRLYLSAVDSKGLLLHFTPMEIGLLVLTALVFICLLLVLKKAPGSEAFEDCCPASVAAALGHAAAAVGIWQTVRTGPAMIGYLGSAWNYLGMAAAVCLVLAGITRLLGKRPFFLLHAVACLFFMVHVVNHYQLWSSNPQMQDYLYALLGAVTLALYSYYTAAFEADSGNSRMVVVTGLAAGFLCLAELAWTQYPWLYLGGALWALAAGCRLGAVPAKERD